MCKRIIVTVIESIIDENGARFLLENRGEAVYIGEVCHCRGDKFYGYLPKFQKKNADTVKNLMAVGADVIVDVDENNITSLGLVGLKQISLLSDLAPAAA